MFEVDNQDHEDQRRELLTLLRATTVITTCRWIFMGCLPANMVAMIVWIKISHYHWSCYETIKYVENGDDRVVYS